MNDYGQIYYPSDTYTDYTILDLEYSLSNGKYLLYTNNFLNDINSIDSYWNCYLWTGIGEYVEFDRNDAVENQDWISMDVTTSTDGTNTYFRYECTVTGNNSYTVCFFNTMSLKIIYLSVTIEYEDVLNLHLSTTEQTTEPIYILSNCYYYEGEYDVNEDFLQNYDIDISYGYDESYDWAVLRYQGFDEEKQLNYNQFRFQIVVNGIYKVRILNFETGDTTYQTFIVDNIGIDNKYGEDVYYNNYNENGEFDPTPVLFLDYIDTTTVRIRTQYFSFNELIMLQCFTKFENDEFVKNENIYNYNITTENNFYDYESSGFNSSLDLYYFYLDVKVDGLYTFQFYNIEKDKYTESSINVNIRQFITDNIDNIDSFTDKMVAWSKLHFRFFNISL